MKKYNMNFIKIFKSYISPDTYESLDAAVEDALYCKKVWIFFPKGLVKAEDFAQQGSLFLRLEKLKELKIQGMVGEESDYSLPEEIGEIRQLEKLVLLM